MAPLTSIIKPMDPLERILTTMERNQERSLESLARLESRVNELEKQLLVIRWLIGGAGIVIGPLAVIALQSLFNSPLM